MAQTLTRIWGVHTDMDLIDMADEEFTFEMRLRWNRTDIWEFADDRAALGMGVLDGNNARMYLD